jgi:hypothetical protein
MRFFRIRPQIRIRRLLLYFGKLLAQLVAVKDTPAGREPWSLKKCIAVLIHPT